jgi:hypothetical protein
VKHAHGQSSAGVRAEDGEEHVLGTHGDGGAGWWPGGVGEEPQGRGAGAGGGGERMVERDRQTDREGRGGVPLGDCLCPFSIMIL